MSVDLIFLNKKLEIVDIIDIANSIQWRERFFETGTFEVYVAFSKETIEKINQSYFIYRNDSKYTGVIERIEIDDDVSGSGNWITITGRMAESLIGRRIVRYLTFYQNILSNCMKKLLDDNLLNPPLQEGETISPRKMSCFETTIINELTFDPEIEIQASFENNLLIFMQETLKTHNASIRVEYAGEKFVIRLFQGTDRSYNQEINPYIAFSKELDNLLSSNYAFDETEEKNVVYVGGEGNVEGEDKKIEKAELLINENEVVSDLDRKETYVNASDIKQTWTENVNGVNTSKTLSNADYRKLLKQRGGENVIFPSIAFEGKIDLSMYVYNEDYFLGDILTIYDENTGIYSNKRLIGMDIVNEGKIYSLEPIFEEVNIDVRYAETEEETTTGYLLAGTNSRMLTESGEYLVQEAAATENVQDKKISELEEATDVSDGCCFPIVSGDTTKRITYGTLKTNLEEDIDVNAAPYIGDNAPAEQEVWLDTNEEEEEQSIATYSVEPTSLEEELTFNETNDDEELTFNE